MNFCFGRARLCRAGENLECENISDVTIPPKVSSFFAVSRRLYF